MKMQSGEQPAMADAAAASGGYDGVGHSLKVVRERRNLALADIASRLRIRRPYLEAIETGRFDELPGPVYVTGFLRQYAEFLGLEPEAVLKNYQAEANAQLQRPVLNFPLPRPEERSPRIWLVVGAVVVAVGIYAVWYRHQEAVRFGQELIQAVPAQLADLVPSPTPVVPSPSPLPPAAPAPVPAPAVTAAPPVAVPPATADQTTPPPTPAPAAPATPSAGTQTAQTQMDQIPPAQPPSTQPPSIQAPAPASAPPVSPPAETAVPPAIPAPNDPTVGRTATPADMPAADPATGSPASADAAAPSATPAAPAAYGATDTNARIRLEATAPAWIQVRGPNNEQVFTRLLNPGERYLVPERAGLTLLTGNAGGLRIVLDGQTLPPLGAEGEVKRGIPLDPAQLRNTGDSAG